MYNSSTGSANLRYANVDFLEREKISEKDTKEEEQGSVKRDGVAIESC